MTMISMSLRLLVSEYTCSMEAEYGKGSRSYTWENRVNVKEMKGSRARHDYSACILCV